MPREKNESEGSCEGTWAKDQRERDYYYDDAHGYESYTPETDEEPPATPQSRKEEKKKPDLDT